MTIHKLTAFGERLINMRVALGGAGKEVGSELAEMIRVRVRLGYGNDTQGAKKKKFEPLRPLTIAYRETISLFPGSSPKKSHLTMTGDMMEQLSHKVDGESVSLFFKTTFAKLKAAWAHDGASNRKKRPFMFLTDSELKRARQIIQKYLDAYIDSLTE